MSNIILINDLKEIFRLSNAERLIFLNAIPNCIDFTQFNRILAGKKYIRCDRSFGNRNVIESPII